MNGARPRATIQLCTHNRAHLLGRVLDACFEQTVTPATYEVVLVDDGSTDQTPLVIEAARRRATCPFTVITQSNAGLARARNAGIARARGERIIFIDDDVLPVPVFVAQHLDSHRRAAQAIVRGAVINTQSFERLPTPTWTPANYSANFFWTSNVSVPLATLGRVGHFSEAFVEYGWEDIELGLRLRRAGVRAVFNRYALAFHYKPPQRACDIAGVLRRARAQARTAAQLRALHPGWRVVLATGDDPFQRLLHRALRASGIVERLKHRIVHADDPEGPHGAQPERELNAAGRRALHALARETYFAELESARKADRSRRA